MSVRQDVINLTVNVNGNQAQSELNNLRKRAADIKLEMDGLKKGTAEYIAKSKELAQVTADMGKLKQTIGVTSLTQKELVAELNKLKALQGSVAPFSEEYKKLGKSIKEVENRLYDVRNGVQGFSSFMSKISDEVKQFGVVAAGYLGFQFIASSFKNIIASSGKLSDSLADISRVTGLTKTETLGLNQQLKDLNTRTSTEGLRNIAIIAGKLGVAKEDIFGFTRAVDKLVVALGDELGDADQISTQLGKILNVFDGKVNEDNISRTGNAIVDLANKGVASGGFIVDFAQRVSGIAKSANIALPDVLALGAGLEEFGARAESGSTAIIKIVNDIGKDIPKAAKIANMEVNEFNKLFASSPTEALLKYSEGLVKNKTAFSDVISSLKDAGEEGARVVSTITILGNKSDVLRGKIKETGVAFHETTKINEAFALKNETLGAQIDKLSKSFNALISSKFVTGFVESLIIGLNSLFSAFQKNNSALDQFKKQEETVTKLQKEMLPLIDRVEELGSKSKLSKDEQIELNKAIQTIGQTIPIAITEFDKYGKAIGISTTKAREFIDLQEAILKEKNRAAIKSENSKIEDLQKELEGYQMQLQQAQNHIRKGLLDSEKDYYNKGIASLSQTIGDLQNRIKGAKGIIAELDGSSLKKTIESIPPPTDGNPAKLGGGESEEDKKAAEKKRKEKEREMERLKADAEKFYQDILKLKKQAEIKGEEPDQAEIDRIKEKYAELIKRSLDFYKQGIITKGKYGEENAILIEAQELEIAAIIKKYQDKRLAELDSAEYEQSLIYRKEYSDELKDAAAKDFADGKINKKQYESEIKNIEHNETTDRIAIAEDYSKTVKKAATDVKNFRKEAAKQTTQDEIAEAELRIKTAKDEALAKAKRAILTSRPGSDAQLKANQDLLKLEFEQDTEFLDKKSEVYKEKEAKLNKDLEDLQNAHTKKVIDNILQVFQAFSSALSSLDSFLAARENRLFNKEKADTDKRKKGYKDELDKKLISKEQYDAKVTAADEALDKKDKELKRKQAERQKALNIFNAVINTASAVVSALGAGPYIGLVLAALVAAAGALQIAAISSEPLPELGTGDWVRTGDKHSDPSGGINAKIERGEAVINAKSMEDPNVYTISGTNAQITGAINGKNGPNWAGGAVIQMAKWQSDKPATINPSMAHIMEQGGIIRPINNNVNVNNSDTEMKAILIRQNQLLEEHLQVAKNYPTQLEAVVSIKKFYEKKAIYDNAKNASAVNG